MPGGGHATTGDEAREADWKEWAEAEALVYAGAEVGEAFHEGVRGNGGGTDGVGVGGGCLG